MPPHVDRLARALLVALAIVAIADPAFAQTNLNRDSFSDPERRPDPNRDHHWRWGLRLQWAM